MNEIQKIIKLVSIKSLQLKLAIQLQRTGKLGMSVGKKILREIKKKKKLKGENGIRNHREKLDSRIKVLFKLRLNEKF